MRALLSCCSAWVIDSWAAALSAAVAPAWSVASLASAAARLAWAAASCGVASTSSAVASTSPCLTVWPTTTLTVLTGQVTLPEPLELLDPQELEEPVTRVGTWPKQRP